MTLDLALRAAVMLGGTLVLVRLLRSAPAGTRRDLLTAGGLLTLLLPLLEGLPIELPIQPLVASVVGPAGAAGVALQEPAGQGTQASTLTVSVQAVVGAVWGLGAIAFIARLARAHWLAHRLLATATPADPTWRQAAEAIDAPPVLAHPQLTTPVVVGLWHPHIVVPSKSDWPLPRRTRALRHEQAHRAARDNVRQLLLELLCAAYWFNPLAWTLAR